MGEDIGVDQKVWPAFEVKPCVESGRKAVLLWIWVDTRFVTSVTITPDTAASLRDNINAVLDKISGGG